MRFGMSSSWLHTSQPHGLVAEPRNDLELATERLHVLLQRREKEVVTPLEAGKLALRRIDRGGNVHLVLPDHLAHLTQAHFEQLALDPSAVLHLLLRSELVTAPRLDLLPRLR